MALASSARTRIALPIDHVMNGMVIGRYVDTDLLSDQEILNFDGFFAILGLQVFSYKITSNKILFKGYPNRVILDFF